MKPWQLAVTAAAGIVLILSTVIGLTALIRGETTRSIVTESPCFADPDGKQCQRVKAKTDRKRSIRSACIITIKAGVGCPALKKKRGGVVPYQPSQGAEQPGGVTKRSRPPKPTVVPDAPETPPAPSTTTPPEPPPAPACDLTTQLGLQVCLGL